jgi:hypothetical protein
VNVGEAEGGGEEWVTNASRIEREKIQGEDYSHFVCPRTCSQDHRWITIVDIPRLVQETDQNESIDKHGNRIHISRQSFKKAVLAVRKAQNKPDCEAEEFKQIW